MDKADKLTKSKKTKYNNIEYRSKIEARWAVFFDCLGITHKYEPDWSDVEINLRTYYYKPDFYISIPSSKQEFYVEIKTQVPTEYEQLKAAAWAKDIGAIIFFYNLQPPNDDTESGWLLCWEEIPKKVIMHDQYWWCECPACKWLGINELGIPMCNCNNIEAFDSVYNWDDIFGTKFGLSFTRTHKLLTAYKTARKKLF
jgi:hypothetical protein